MGLKSPPVYLPMMDFTYGGIIPPPSPHLSVMQEIYRDKVYFEQEQFMLNTITFPLLNH